MKISELIGRRFKEKPSEVKLKSHEFLIRGGYVRPLASGIFSSLPPALKVLHKIENIVREEMNRISAQEVEMPLVQPRELWEESGRYGAINDELARLKDRNQHDMVLAMTHEEATVALVRGEATSYKDYPFSVYQFAKKFRDEARPRGGLIRVREFTMKDAYSFHRDQADLENWYAKYAVAYDRIFARVGIPEVISIQSDSGMMGGKVAHEYMLLTPCGEDTIITCSECSYKANREVAQAKIVPIHTQEEMKPLTKIETPNIKTIEALAQFLNIPTSRLAKSVVYAPVGEDPRAIVVMIRGDREVNESKLSKVLRAMPVFAGDSVFADIGAIPGYTSGIGLKNARIIIDESLLQEVNLVTGANEEGYHFIGFNVKRDIPTAEFADIVSVQDGDVCLCCGHEIKISRGIEVGNIFQLGDKYTKPMKMMYVDENGHNQTPIMGCYGIGIGRLMASVIEARHDARGPIWPVSLAPWPVSVTALPPKTGEESEVVETARIIYQKLQEAGIDVLLDDRKASAGEKFADIDLLGVPFQLVVSQRTLENDSVEYKVRGTEEKGFIPLNEVIEKTKKWLQMEENKLIQWADSVQGIQK